MESWVARYTQPDKHPEAKHAHGQCIIGVQGCGKTHFVDHQRAGEARWVDADTFLRDLNILRPTDNQPDVVRAATAVNDAVCRGMWVLASTWWDIENFSAAVIPPLNTVVSRLKAKTGDETMTGDLAKLARQQTTLLTRYSTAKNIPSFTSVETAVRAAELNITRIYAAS